MTVAVGISGGGGGGGGDGGDVHNPIREHPSIHPSCLKTSSPAALRSTFSFSFIFTGPSTTHVIEAVLGSVKKSPWHGWS